MNHFKIEVLIEKEAEDRVESFWYRGESIGMASDINGKKLYIDTCGEIRVSFEEDGMFYKNAQATDMARDLNLNDEGLAKLSEFDGWDMNNWFAIREFDANGEMVGDDLAICHTYDEAFALLEEVAKEKSKEYWT